MHANLFFRVWIGVNAAFKNDQTCIYVATGFCSDHSSSFSFLANPDIVQVATDAGNWGMAGSGGQHVVTFLQCG